MKPKKPNKMKKTLQKISQSLTTFYILALTKTVAFAGNVDEFVEGILPKPSAQVGDEDFVGPVQEGVNDQGVNGAEAALDAFQDLPDLSLPEFIAALIRILLGWSIIIVIVAIVVTGIFFLTAQGKDDQIAKAKDIILYLIIGLVIMASAYAIIAGLSQFNFLEAV